MASSKRKSSSQAAHPQPTLRQHFENSERKSNSASQSLSPDSKRRKLGKNPNCITRAPTLSSDSMYNFGTTQAAPVDLTGPHGTTPRARRISNLGGLPNGANGASFGTRKLVVKNLRPKGAAKPTDYIDSTTKELDQALAAIFKDEQPSKSNEELYKGAENICKLGHAADLSKLVDRRCKEHISSSVRPVLAQKADDKNVDVLRAVVDAWQVWQKQSNTIRSILFFLDRTYLLQNAKTSLTDSSIKIFRSQVFGEAAIAGKTVEGACELLLADRKHQAPDTALFKAAIDMFHELGVYTNEFEPRLLATSQTYIADWSDRECQDKELPEYVASCNKFIGAEMARCDGFDLDDTTRRELLQLLEHHCIDRKETELQDRDSVADLLDIEDITNLRALYYLLQRRRLETKLKTPFSQWIDDTGTAIVFDEKDQDGMVVKLLSLKVKLDKIWRNAFQKDRDLSHTVRESFETFINKSKKTSATWGTDNSKPGEMIAKYVDQLLRSGAKAIPRHLNSATKPIGLAKTDTNEAMDIDVAEERAAADDEGRPARDEDAEVDNQLDQVLDLFRFVHGKAVFEAFYKKDLARRLLMGRSASNDAEKSMLNRLQAECGSNFTHNLEQMFRDIELARGEMVGYKDKLLANERKPPVDLTVNILSAAAWPTYPDIAVVIPPEIKRAIDDFERYYHQKHTGRKLSWKHALAHSQLRAHFPKGMKEIVVSSFQAIVLLLFNNIGKEDHLTYDRIKAESGLPEAEVKRTLQSLACAKLRPLTKHPKGREINDADTFTVNMDFTHERFRVKINAIQLKETREENKETHERVAADRQYETQAAIVRIMKSRKTVGHQELIAETIKATKNRGVLQPLDIKRNIDKLIDKEYMERMEGGKYAYLA